MGKISRKRAARPEKNNGGCVWGLFNMLHFRQARNPQKLLSDRKRRSGRFSSSGISLSNKQSLLENFGISNCADEPGAENGDLGQSITMLMEEEIPKAQKNDLISGAKSKQLKPDSRCENHIGKNLEQIIISSSIITDLHDNDLRPSTSVTSDQSHFQGLVERFSNHNLNLAALLQDIYDWKCKDQHSECENSINLYKSPKIKSPRVHDDLDQSNTQLIQNNYIPQKTQSEILEFFLFNKIFQTTQTAYAGPVHRSEEFANALQILSSNKEWIHNLLQDPNTHLAKYIQQLQIAQGEKPLTSESCNLVRDIKFLGKDSVTRNQHQEPASNKLFQRQGLQKIFRKKDKAMKSCSRKDDQEEPNRVIVLKPIPARDESPMSASSCCSSPWSPCKLRAHGGNERRAFHFSLGEIKRRMKQAIGERKKERDLMPIDGNFEKPRCGSLPGEDDKRISIDVEVPTLVTASICNNEDVPDANRIEEKAKPNEPETSTDVGSAISVSPLDRESNFQREAKKHLLEMLDSKGGDAASLPGMHIRKLTALKENSFSSGDSPDRHKEPGLSPQQMRISPIWSPDWESNNEGIESLHCSHGNSDAKLEVGHLSDELHSIRIEEELSTMGTQILGGLIIVDTVESELIYAGSLRDEITENNDHELVNLAEIYKDDKSRSPRRSNLDSFEDEPKSLSPSVPPGILLIQNTEAPEIIIEKPERPSPVSVLEPPLLDDIISPRDVVTEETEQDSFPAPTRELYFEECDDCEVIFTASDYEYSIRTWMEDEEFTFGYIRSLLVASGLVHYETWESWSPSCRLLDPSLFDEVETPSGDVPDGLKLLFDRVSEVLEEMHERYLTCNPQLSFFMPDIRPFPSGENLLREVWRIATCHCILSLPSTLNEIIEKDMNITSWMDIRGASGDIGAAVGDEILEDVLDETMLEFCD